MFVVPAATARTDPLTLVAVRFNAAMKAKYDALRAAGKPPKVALTAIMRKLIILANALIRDARIWSPLPA